jgi:hypothetical protein
LAIRGEVLPTSRDPAAARQKELQKGRIWKEQHEKPTSPQARPPEPAPQDYQAREKIKNRGGPGYDQRPDEELSLIEARPQSSERETTTGRDLSAPEKAKRQQLCSLHEKKEYKIAKDR